MIKFHNVSLYKSVWLDSKEVFFDQKKEIIFVWRSNVGKSSIMNAIFNKKDLVKTSTQPGKTKRANMFLVENKYYCTDLPWYGFAKVSKEMRAELDGLISWYIEEQKHNIVKGVLLIDSKLWPQQSDIDMYKYLLDLWIEILIVLSKVDKLSKSQLHKTLLSCKKLFFWQDIIWVSVPKKVNILALCKYLSSTLLSK